MIKAEKPENEIERMRALLSFGILDTPAEEDYDNIVKLASEICGIPISLISFIDDERQWYKATHGVEIDVVPRDIAFCSHAILSAREALVVNDMSKDPRFSENPMVTGETQVRFYAGVPLVTSDGFPIGSICLVDDQVHEISDDKIVYLKMLANHVVRLLELRKTVDRLEKVEQNLTKSIKNLEEFGYVISHDLKAPIRNVVNLTEILVEEAGKNLSEDNLKIVSLIRESATNAVGLVDGVLKYSKSTSSLSDYFEEVELKPLIDEVLRELTIPVSFKIDVLISGHSIISNRLALKQIISNLVGNAIRYNDKDQSQVQISAFTSIQKVSFIIKDNGKGIEEKNLKDIFRLFYMENHLDKELKGSSGVGLAIVKKLVEELSGNVSVQSEPGEGCEFLVEIPI